MLVSGKSAKTSVTPLPEEAAAAGPEVRGPPATLFHPDQVGLVYVRYQSLLSTAPRANILTWFVSAELAAGSLAMTPPSDAHPVHTDPFHDFHHTALSVPRTKTSSRFEAIDAAAGAAPTGRAPPRLLQP